MTREEVRRLVGGYATGTLTESELSVLMQAALDDQDLFDELAREQELREILSAPGVKQRLQTALRPEERRGWWTPWAWAGGAASAAALLFVLMRAPTPPTQIAEVRQAPTVASDAPSPVVVTPPSDRRTIASARPNPQPSEKLSANAPAASAGGGGGAAAPAATPAAAPPPPEAPQAVQAPGQARSASQVSLARERDQAPPERRRDEPQETEKKEQTKSTASTASSVTVSEDAQLMKTAPAPPPAGRAAQAQLPSAAKARAVPGALAGFAGRIAFRYSLAANVLTITSERPGYLAVNQQPARRVNVGTVEQVPLPAGATSATITYSPEVTLKDALSQPLRQTTGRAGTVLLDGQSDAVSIEITF